MSESRRLRVAVTLRRSDATAYDEPRDALARDWISLFERRGFCPVLLPNAPDLVLTWAEELGVEALLLTGGEDLGEDAERDLAERALLRWALEGGRPVAAVCRGLHVVQDHFGGDVVALDDPAAHVARAHALAPLAPGAPTLRVNSFHRRGVVDLAPPLVAAARADDGCVEACEHPAALLRAVQFHPERPGCDAAAEDWLFARWPAAATTQVA